VRIMVPGRGKHCMIHAPSVLLRRLIAGERHGHHSSCTACSCCCWWVP
jgi:hypothetical protein